MNTNTTHTPEPWIYDDGFIYGADNTMICDPHADNQDIDEREANARLIAAAPELLERLQDCVKVLQSFQDQLQGKSIAVTANLEYARAAIAKAEGRAE